LDYHHDVGVVRSIDLEASLEFAQMKLEHLQNKHVLVVGLGESGLAAVRFCLRSGATVTVADTRENPTGLTQLPTQAKFKSGALQESLLDGVDMVVYSPGLSPHHAPLKEFIAAACARGLRFDGEVELFAQALLVMREQLSYQPKIVGITGTNGKTTVTKLTAHLFNAAGKYAVAAGNVSPATLDALTQALDTEHLPEVWVLELSSFQLASLHSLHFDAATVLNLSEDHLDWHLDMDDYRACKQTIYSRTSAVVINREDNATEPPVRPVTKKGEDAVTIAQYSFGCDEPAQYGDFGLVSLNGLPWLAEAVAAEDEFPMSATAKKKFDKQERPWRMNRLIPLDTLVLNGAHNYANVLAALALCRALGIAQAKTLRAVQTYKGEPHRCELVKTIDGVSYIDDSKGTNVGATVAALSGFSQPIVLIAGGDGKGQDFSPLKTVIAKSTKHVFLIGKDASTIARVVEAAGVSFEHCQSLEQAVIQAAQIAQTGDLVLLSPACASLDMFKNYKHRAQVFVAAVEQLPTANSTASEVTSL
jgi:UDP-N-acetylmuramoylalanine--D-glutamate ligase